MARFIVAAILVFSLAGCAEEQVGLEAGALMTLGEQAADQGHDEHNYIWKTTLVDADTTDAMNDHTIPARIYALPEDQGGKPLPFQDLAIFDMTSESRDDPLLTELPLSSLEEPIEVPESPVVTEVWPTPEPSVSDAVTGNSYLIQLGALPSRESARREWTRIERRHADLVQGQVLTIIPVELNNQDGTVFRLRTGPISEIKTARSLCRKFRSDGQDCFVVKSKNPG